MPLFVNKVYSVEDGDYMYGFDLLDDTYFECRYVVTVGLDLRGLSHNEALLKLYQYNGTVHRFFEKKDFLKTFDTKPDGPLNHVTNRR
jgi:hypothetical protein